MIRGIATAFEPGLRSRYEVFETPKGTGGTVWRGQCKGYPFGGPEGEGPGTSSRQLAVLGRERRADKRTMERR
jgi:hypothetical protein